MDAKPKDFAGIMVILTAYGMVESWLTQESFKKLLRRKNGFYLVAKKAGKIVGVSFGDICGGHHGYLYKGSTHPEHRREGVRRALHEEMKKRFLAIGVDKLICQVSKKNAEADAMLRHIGFVDPHCNWLEMVTALP